MKEVYLICAAKVCASDVQDGPEFIMLTLGKETMQSIAGYQDFLSLMVKAKLDPYKIEEFNYAATFKKPCDRNKLNKEESKALLFESPAVKREWLTSFSDEKQEGADSTLEELADEDNTVDVCCLKVKKDGFMFSMFIKHTDTRVETDTISNKMVKKINKLLGV
jgi:hypothetical protein